MPSLPNWTRSLLPFGAGAATVLAFAPFHLFPFALLGPAVLFYLWLDSSPKRAFGDGWLFGLGLLGFGVFWMHISIDQFGNIGTGLAIGLTLLFVAAMSLYYGLAGWLGERLGRQRKQSVQLLLFVALWVLIEWVRGWFLTGFPWLALGYSQADTPLRGFAPLLGVYGISLTVAVSAALLVALFLARAGRRRIIAIASLLLIWIAGWGLGGVQWTEPVGERLSVVLIQGNIPQERKWKIEQLRPTLDLYIDHTMANWDKDLIIWPETAMPAFRHQLEKDVITPLSEVAREQQSQLLVGIPVWEQEQRRSYNAMLAMGINEGVYYKRHLVPFGEFMPMRWLLEPLVDLLQIPMSDFASGDNSKPLLQLAGYPAGISICYEDAFGEEVIEALPEAAFLVNASNDAWFGDSLAPPQHLQIARMRALETGRFLLRSTNTGISAIIQPDGELQGYSPAFQMHVLKGEIQPMTGTTPYARVGNWAVVLLSVLLLGSGLGLGWKKREPSSTERP
jgi:apolipoprotein N-acyltransferase